MLKILEQLLDLIYKKPCYFCKNDSENSRFCSTCFNKIKLLPCKPLTTINNVQIYCATSYKDNIVKMIRGVKYHNQKELAYFQAKLMYNYWTNLEISKSKFVIIPVPISDKRKKERKYNHMSLVATEFAKLTGYSINETLIRRIKDTKPQYKLDKKERAKNLKGAFIAQKENFINLENQKLLIIDDVLTTGSTVNELIKILKSEKVNDITVFTTSCSEYNLSF